MNIGIVITNSVGSVESIVTVESDILFKIPDVESRTNITSALLTADDAVLVEIALNELASSPLMIASRAARTVASLANCISNVNDSAAPFAIEPSVAVIVGVALIVIIPVESTAESVTAGNVRAAAVESNPVIEAGLIPKYPK